MNNVSKAKKKQQRTPSTSSSMLSPIPPMGSWKYRRWNTIQCFVYILASPTTTGTMAIPLQTIPFLLVTIVLASPTPNGTTAIVAQIVPSNSRSIFLSLPPTWAPWQVLSKDYHPILVSDVNFKIWIEVSVN